MLRRVLVGNTRPHACRILRPQVRRITASTHPLQRTKPHTGYSEEADAFAAHQRDVEFSDPPKHGIFRGVQQRRSKICDNFCEALVKQDASTVNKAWETLKAYPSELSDPVNSNKISEEIAAALADDFIPAPLESCAPALEESAAMVASEGFPRGLFAIMHTYLHLQDHEATLRVYHIFMKLANSSPSTKTEDEEAADDDEHEQALASSQKRLVVDEVSEYTSRQEDKLMTEALMYAIAACAIRFDFNQALHLIIDANRRVTGGRVRAFMEHLGTGFPSEAHIHHFLRRAVTASIISRSSGLYSYVLDLSQQRATAALRSLFDDVVQGLTSSDAWLTLHPEDVSSQTPLLVDDRVWGLLLTGFMRSGKLDWAEELWDTMISLGITPPIDTWKSLVAGYGFLGMPDRVLYTWHAMIRGGYTPDAKLYRSLIFSLILCRREQEARKYLEEFERLLDQGKLSCTEMDIRRVFNAAISSYLHTAREGPALAILTRMEEIGPTPDIRTLDLFLAWFSKRSQYKAFASTLRKIDTYNLEPSAVTYTTILSAMLPVRDDAVSIVFNFMRQHGETPNVAMYTTVIDALMGEQTMEAFRMAMRLLQQMETDKNIQPNVVTFTCIITGILRGNWMDRDTAQEYIALLTNKMTKRRLAFSSISYHFFIQVGLANPEPEGLETVMHYYREMRRRRITLMGDTWYTLLNGLIGRQAWDMANVVVDDLKKSGTRLVSSLKNLIRRVEERQSNTTRVLRPPTLRNR